jgi:hypothetical protein
MSINGSNRTRSAQIRERATSAGATVIGIPYALEGGRRLTTRRLRREADSMISSGAKPAEFSTP